jgi:hypothetical protein
MDFFVKKYCKCGFLGILYNALLHNQRFFAKPTLEICSKGIQQNLVCIFRSYIIFSTLFRSSTYFLGIYLFHFRILKKEKRLRLEGRLPARGLLLRRASGRLRRPGRLGGPKANSPSGPIIEHVGVPARAQARGHRIRGPHGGELAGSPPVAGRWLGWRGEHQRAGSGRQARRRQRRRTMEVVRRGAVKATLRNGVRWRRWLQWMMRVSMGLSSCKGARGTMKLS